MLNSRDRSRTDAAADDSTPAFAQLADLASARIGGRAIAASDDFFAAKSNLVKAGPAIFVPGKYTARGKWMDGWESRRRRTPGHDWCVVELGMRGRIAGVDVDTSFFTGNFPPRCSIDALDATDLVVACASRPKVPAANLVASASRPKVPAANLVASASRRKVPSADLVASAFRRKDTDGLSWTTILPETDIQGDRHNFLIVTDDRPWTHLRLNIFPDGGVARLRVYGEVVVDWKRAATGVRPVDLAAIRNGGLVLAASDVHYGAKDNMLMPGRAKNMGDGWETRRRRGPGHDWAIVRLGTPGTVATIEIDTNHFKGNYPDSASVEGCFAPGTTAGELSSATWFDVLPQSKLKAHHRHVFARQLRHRGPVSHVRLNIFPDGGVSRFRVHGTLAR